MKIIECQQGTPEWLEARVGIATASELDSLVTPLWKLRKGEGVTTYICKKLAERWLGEPLPSFNSVEMEQGNILEEEARPWFEFTSGLSVRAVGFVTTDDGSAGCSPDGLLDDGSGIEIKCPACHTHTRYLLAGEVPDEYRAQVQGSMYVTGAASWRFLSYCRGFPALLLVVERDPQAQVAIAEAIGNFNRLMANGWQRLCEINGGEPQRLSSAAKQEAMQRVFDQVKESA